MLKGVCRRVHAVCCRVACWKMLAVATCLLVKDPKPSLFMSASS